MSGLLAAASSSSGWIDLGALWKIVLVGLLCGAGLPMVFAIGLRALSLPGRGATAPGGDDNRIYYGNMGGALVAALCLAIVLAAIAWGIFTIVTG